MADNMNPRGSDDHNRDMPVTRKALRLAVARHSGRPTTAVSANNMTLQFNLRAWLVVAFEKPGGIRQ